MSKLRLLRTITLVIIGLLLVLFGFMLAGFAEAQATEYNVGFYITDHNKSPLKDAFVDVKGVGVETTNEKGACVFQLEKGSYDVKIGHENYETKTKKIYVQSSTTLTESLEKETDQPSFWSQFLIPIIIVVIIVFILIVLLFSRAFRRSGRRRGGSFAFIVLGILLLAMVFNCGCISNVQDTISAKKDGNPLYAGEDNWFFTTLDFEVVTKAFDSKMGAPPEHLDNKATKQLSSKYKITITPISPSEARGSDDNDDGIPDGIQITTNYALGVDGIYESIPQAVNSIGYDGKLYNGIPRSNVQLASDIQPQTKSKVGVYSDNDRGIMDQLFSTDIDRPFLKLRQNFVDDFLEEDIYITVPVTVKVSAEGKIIKREIFSMQVDCPVFIHIPPPGQDAEIKEYLSLELVTPLNILGGGLVRIEPQGSTISGKAWVNIETGDDLIENAIKKLDDWMKAQDRIQKNILALGMIVAFGPIGLLISVVAGWLLWDSTEEPPTNIDNYVFIPGFGWEFDKGILKGLKEYLYDILPAVAEPTEE